MAAAPQGDWTIADVRTLCKQESLEFRKPKRGSHHVVSSPHIRDSLTVPSAKPIKAPYIRELVSFAHAHRNYAAQKEDADD